MSDENIFSEVDEALRSERLRAFWRRFAPFIIGGAVLIVLAVAVNEGWDWWQKSQSANSSDAFYAAIEQAEAGNIAEAQAALNEVAETGSGQYPVLAQFRQASLLAGDGKTDEALAAYDALAGTASDARLRDLALLLGAYLLVDKGDVAGVQSRLEVQMQAGQPFSASAREAVGLAQYAAGDKEAAWKSFEAIASDASATASVLQRVQLYLAQLMAEGAAPDEVDAANEAAPTGDVAPADDAAPEADAAAPAPEADAAAPAETPAQTPQAQ